MAEQSVQTLDPFALPVSDDEARDIARRAIGTAEQALSNIRYELSGETSPHYVETKLQAISDALPIIRTAAALLHERARQREE